MGDLLRKPTGTVGVVHDITPKSANWGYVGFALHRLSPGDAASGSTRDLEAILVVVEGKLELTVGDTDFGEIGDRMSVFEKTAPHCVYAPGRTEWVATATTECVLAICTAPAKGDYPVQRLGPDGIELTPRGKGQNQRFINNIAMEGRDVAGSLLVTEVFTPPGNWSSYPSHRHDEDDFPRMTYLEETYYHRLNPAQGFGVQRVYTEDGTLDETMAVKDGDVVLVPKGHHPCAAPYGYEMYYLNVMAGPLRKWRFENDPDHDWIAQRDAE
ncbi:MAG: 5-deoxy-glucuronate isomerase [Boseongicola sp.]|nr:5-deoxy-glucuronate isomerase [Boseongicola sp.]